MKKASEMTIGEEGIIDGSTGTVKVVCVGQNIVSDKEGNPQHVTYLFVRITGDYNVYESQIEFLKIKKLGIEKLISDLQKEIERAE